MNDLNELRNKLDSVDAELMRLYTQRMEICKEIGAYKRENGLPITDEEREKKVVSARTEGLCDELRPGGEALMRALIAESKRLQARAGNLYLIGMPDCGKTRTARKLAPLLMRRIADTDKLIAEKEGVSIDGIFDTRGEEYFRDLETQLLRALAKKGGLIVATGGGMPMREENRRIMRASGAAVFLDRALEMLYGQDTTGRPLLRGDVDANIERLYYERRGTYSETADLTVDPDAPGAAEAIAEFFEGWTENGVL